MDIEAYAQHVIEFVRVHQVWAAPVVFALCFAESLAFISLLVPAWGALVAIGARKILLLNGHGGNDIPCKAALRELKSEFERQPDVYIAYDKDKLYFGIYAHYGDVSLVRANRVDRDQTSNDDTVSVDRKSTRLNSSHRT